MGVGVSGETSAVRPMWRRWWFRLGALTLLTSAALGADWLRPPEAQLSTALALRVIEGYQRTLSPRMDGLGVSCRFQPTCSHYGHAVIEKHGMPRGAALAAGRIVRCGPWTPAGTVDPP